MSELNMEHLTDILCNENLTNEQKVHIILSDNKDHQVDSVVEAILQCLANVYTVPISQHTIVELNDNDCNNESSSPMYRTANFILI